jgi:type IV pilus assembly protein PilP
MLHDHEPSLQRRFQSRRFAAGILFVIVGIGALVATPKVRGQIQGAMQAPPVPAPASVTEDPMFAGVLDAFDYDPRGRRDPFSQATIEKPVDPGASHGPLLPLQQYEVTQLRLVGVIWDVRKPRAMIRDPGGRTHIVGLNTKLGPRNGYIAVIREGEMVVVETVEQEGRLLSTAQVVKITK